MFKSKTIIYREVQHTIQAFLKPALLSQTVCCKVNPCFLLNNLGLLSCDDTINNTSTFILLLQTVLTFDIEKAWLQIWFEKLKQLQYSVVHCCHLNGRVPKFGYRTKKTYVVNEIKDKVDKCFDIKTPMLKGLLV